VESDIFLLEAVLPFRPFAGKPRLYRYIQQDGQVRADSLRGSYY
jgi:hypothetical protein